MDRPAYVCSFTFGRRVLDFTRQIQGLHEDCPDGTGKRPGGICTT